MGKGKSGRMITKGVKELCAEAEAEIETVTAEEAIKIAGDEAVQLVDIRDIRELWREGAVPGAVHAPRGMLEFWVDPEAPITARFLPTASALSFSAPAACVRHSLRNRYSVWGWHRWLILPGVSLPGRKQAGQSSPKRENNTGPHL